MKYHVHVYKIESKAEVEIEAENEIEAKKQALAKKDDLDFMAKSDCEYIAMEFQI